MNPADELKKLTDLFPGGGRLIEEAEHVPAALVPEPYQRLLVHEHHMTVTMEEFYRTPVAVRVIDRSQTEDVYSREILLERSDSGRVVQFGIVRFDLSYVTQTVRDEILRETVPLGRILINYNVLRHIDLGALLKIRPGTELQRMFGCRADQVTFGRLATIFCNQKPAVDLLEISAPVN
ncbi:MAG: hypothetical protein ACT4QC_01950 [Planctomycetaceae bacterium]